MWPPSSRLLPLPCFPRPRQPTGSSVATWVMSRPRFQITQIKSYSTPTFAAPYPGGGTILGIAGLAREGCVTVVMCRQELAAALVCASGRQVALLPHQGGGRWGRRRARCGGGGVQLGGRLHRAGLASGLLLHHGQQAPGARRARCILPPLLSFDPYTREGRREQRVATVAVAPPIRAARASVAILPPPPSPLPPFAPFPPYRGA